MTETGPSAIRRLSLQVQEITNPSGVERERRPSFLRKTVSTAIRGNEARQKWKQLEKARASCEDVEQQPVVDYLEPQLGKLSRSLGLEDHSGAKTPRRSLRNTSSAVFDAYAGKEVLSDVPLFKDCSVKFLEALSAKVHTRLVEPGTDIYLEGDQGDSLFFLSRGEVEVRHGDEVKSTCQDGEVFGEMAAVSKHPALTTRSATVRATGLCDFKVLQRDDLQQVLSHFREDAKRLEDKVERHIEELREQGALPARREWWRLDTSEKRRSSATSIASATSEGGFRQSAWKRALSGMGLARRLSHSIQKPHAYTMAMSAMAGLASHAAPGLPNRGRRMSDGMLLVRQPERPTSTSSVASLQSICERQDPSGEGQLNEEDDGGRSRSISSSSSSSGSSQTSGSRSNPEWALIADDASSRRRSSAESLELDVAEASHSIRVLDPEESEHVERIDPPPAASADVNIASKSEQVRCLSLLLDIWSPKLAEAAANPGEIVATLKIQDESDLKLTAPTLPSLERAARADSAPRQSESQESLKTVATVKLPSPSSRPEHARRLLSMREQRQRAVNLHPFNQGGRVAGSIHEATRKGLARANLAALRVCHKEPIIGAASRHQAVRSKQANSSAVRHTACSKLRQPRTKMGLGPKVWAAPELAVQCPTTLWQDFQALRMQEANSMLSVCD
ncbi:Kcnh1 [Symbiodinium pilosum]|uniref:Kcnh1 protein n=1 Tax=Symbiodinium pilosum TaxID=2952 RepID=A0A812WN39_SYMPI|nr:Kcnh1 [Symbiodinium pilosum]